MAKDKEKSVNPVAAQRKAEKRREIKKGKAAVEAQRNERLAHRNPRRLQDQVDELKAAKASGSLSQKVEKVLQDLERDLSRILKARAATGQDGAKHANNEQRRQPNSVLGKRGREWDQDRPLFQREQSSDTDPEVRTIPMPQGTPPPIPRRVQTKTAHGSEKAREIDAQASAPTELRVVYESAPVVRNLHKEAIGFVPTTVRRKLEAVKPGVKGRLLEEHELQALEAQGYTTTGRDSRRDEYVENQPEWEELHNVHSEEHLENRSDEAMMQNRDAIKSFVRDDGETEAAPFPSKKAVVRAALVEDGSDDEW